MSAKKLCLHQIQGTKEERERESKRTRGGYEVTFQKPYRPQGGHEDDSLVHEVLFHRWGTTFNECAY